MVGAASAGWTPMRFNEWFDNDFPDWLDTDTAEGAKAGKTEKQQIFIIVMFYHFLISCNI